MLSQRDSQACIRAKFREFLIRVRIKTLYLYLLKKAEFEGVRFIFRMQVSVVRRNFQNIIAKGVQVIDSQFAKRLRDEVQELLGAKVRVTLCPSLEKEENTKLLFYGDESIASPVLHLEKFCRATGEDSIEGMAQEIALWYGEIMDRKEGICQFPGNYEAVRKNLVIKLLGKEEAKKLSREVVRCPYMDFTMVFDILIMLGRGSCVTCRVKEADIKRWQVDVKDLVEAAGEFMPQRFPALLQTMEEVMEELGEGRGAPLGECIYVLTNESRYWGASVLLYEDCLREVGGRLQEDFYVIPSSVHEVILLPVSKAPDCLRINQMIREINRTQLKEEEVLGEAAYLYEWEKDRLSPTKPDTETEERQRI